MSISAREVWRYIAVLVMLSLPVVLLINSVETFRELSETQAVYLRNRAATIAARLENSNSSQSAPELLADLSTEEPALVDLAIHDTDAGNPILQSIWEGETLFHTERFTVDGEEIFRAYVPFHLDQRLHIAQIDLAAEGADYLIAHTRQHIALTLVASLALVLFAIYFVWSESRALRLHRRQLELEHLARLGEMSAVLAHEIRNPLGAIKGFVQLALEKANTHSRPLLDPVLEETGRLEALVNDLLMYGRPRQPDNRATPWSEIGGRLDTHAAEAIGERPIQFLQKSSVTEVRTDPDLLTQILLNLLRNSIEAVGETPDAEVRLEVARRSRGGTEIIITDNGPGIPEQSRAKLFEPFFTTRTNGTGLGLPIARKLARALGGDLELEAAAPRGTVATLRLP